MTTPSHDDEPTPSDADAREERAAASADGEAMAGDAMDDSATDGGAKDDRSHDAESDGDGASSRDGDAGQGGLTRAEKIRYAIYAVLLVVGIGILIWQFVKDEPRQPIVLGLFVASEDEMREVSTRETPVYWIGPDPLPTRTQITAALPGEKRTKITQNLRGAFLYQSLNANGEVRDEMDAPYATVYTRTVDGPTRYNIAKTRRECAAGKCPGGLTRITGRFGEAFIEPNAGGGWMARLQRGNSLIFVSAGKPLLPEPTLTKVRPFSDAPLSDVTPRG